MAGGTGERFWPLGRKEKPKQLLKLTGSGKSLMQESIERALLVFKPEDIYVITSSFLLSQIEEDLKAYEGLHIVAEPAKRNTAPCLAFATEYILQDKAKAADEITMAVLTADHIISPPEAFANDIKACLSEAEEGQHLVTLGIVPTYPATGFGYIKTAGKINADILKAEKFVEKPDQKLAESYLDEGGYYWNSGMFFWRLDLLKQELSSHYEGSAKALADLGQALALDDSKSLNEAFTSLEPTSIDYALMEKSDKVALKPSTFKWKDAGSLDILAELNKADSQGNHLHDFPEIDLLRLDSKGNIISAPAGKKVALVGIEDMMVIDTGDALLVCPRDRAQDVKKIVGML